MVLLPLVVGGVVLTLVALQWLLTNRWAFILLRATLGTLLIGGGALGPSVLQYKTRVRMLVSRADICWRTSLETSRLRSITR